MMSKTVVIHTADIHLRNSQFGRFDRGRDFTAAAEQVVLTAAHRGAHYILACGDILNSKRPSSNNIRDLLKLNKKLKAVGIVMYCIPGDHDFCEPSWTELLAEGDEDPYIIDITNRLIELNHKDAPQKPVTVFGAPAPCMHPEAFIQDSRVWPEADILLYHGPFKEFAAYDMGENALKVSDIPFDKYQAVLLGDLHSCKYIQRKHNKGQTLIGYPGPTEYCSGNEKETTKSVTVLAFENGKLLPFDRRRDIVSLSTRRVIRRVITSEQDMVNLLSDLQKEIDNKPLVYVKYRPEVNNVFNRITQVLDPRVSIIQTQEIPNYQEIDEDGIVSNPGHEALTTAKDLLPLHVPSSSPVFATCLQLCDPDADVSSVLDAYIDERLTLTENNEEF